MGLSDFLVRTQLSKSVFLLKPQWVLQRPHSRGRAGAGLYYRRTYACTRSLSLAGLRAQSSSGLRSPSRLSPEATAHTAPRLAGRGARGARRPPRGARGGKSGWGRRGPGVGCARGARRAARLPPLEPPLLPAARSRGASQHRRARGSTTPYQRGNGGRAAARAPPRGPARGAACASASLYSVQAVLYRTGIQLRTLELGRWFELDRGASTSSGVRVRETHGRDETRALESSFRITDSIRRASSELSTDRTYDLNLTLPRETLGAFQHAGISLLGTDATRRAPAHDPDPLHGGSPCPELMAGERGIYAALIGIRSMLRS